jgi:predicted nucleic acid-binding protein
VPFVIDASVAANWHFVNERSAEGDLILEKLNLDRASVPEIWWFEIRNVMLIGERRSRTTRERTELFLKFLSDLPIDVAPRTDDAPIMELARRHNLSFYDACYVELAQQRALPLATFDQAMARAAAAEGIELVGN